ncbi:MAG TPA: hypothetical protein VOB72_15460, partial [Candidatus Dormibacteraeota bacterium]|nr:hypothetical protein [Candidatus Dormibacteraeota bacterium]
MRYVVRFLVVLPLLLLLLAPGAAAPAAASSAFTFNWMSDPAAPAAWTPGTANDWDVIANIDAPTDATGTMAAGHGTDCSAPPATHQISSLGDAVYLCKNHMMTAVFGGGDAATTYGAVYFTPAQLLDWSSGTATLSWQVSTERLSARDWWAVNLTPFAQNLMLPLDNFLPAYQGEPASGLELKLDQATCRSGGTGSYLRVSTVSFGGAHEITQNSPCIEDNVAPSFKVRTPFQVQLSAGHLKVFMPGTAAVWYDGPVSLPFNQAVVQFSHHSYNPGKADNPDGSPGLPNTYHWSGVSIAPSAPFTMLRPQQPVSLHEGRSPALTLAAPAPANAFLRFAAIGAIQVSTDGGRTFTAAKPQDADMSAPERFTSYWTPVAAGVTQLVFRGQPNQFGQPWWVEDVSVWAHGAPPARAVAPAPAPSASAAPKPGPVGGIAQGNEVLK